MRGALLRHELAGDTEKLRLVLPADMSERIVRVARRLDRSRSWVVRAALLMALPDLEAVSRRTRR